MQQGYPKKSLTPVLLQSFILYIAGNVCTIPKCNLGTEVAGIRVNISPPINAFEMCSYKDSCLICVHSIQDLGRNEQMYPLRNRSLPLHITSCYVYVSTIRTHNYSSELLWGLNILNENILIDARQESRGTFLWLPPYSSKIGAHHCYHKP